MWDLPGPGLEPVSPALAGRFLTTMPPEKSEVKFFNTLYIFFFFFWPGHATFRILVPRPGIEPRPTAVKAPSPNYRTTREFPTPCISDCVLSICFNDGIDGLTGYRILGWKSSSFRILKVFFPSLLLLGLKVWSHSDPWASIWDQFLIFLEDYRILSLSTVFWYFTVCGS